MEIPRSGLLTGDETFTEPIHEIKVASAESGIVKRLHVELGSQVMIDDLMLELDAAVIEATRNIALAKSRNQAKLNAARVEFKIKNDRYQKLLRLLDEGAGSPEEVERALGDTAVAEQNIEAIREELGQHQLEVLQYDAQLERRRIRSPIQGQVVEIRKKVGEHVSQSDPHLITIVRLDALRAVFHIPTATAGTLRKDDIVPVHLTETDERVEGKVEFVAPITRADSGRVRVDVVIDNQHSKYRSGVRCQLLNGVLRASRPANLR